MAVNFMWMRFISVETTVSQVATGSCLKDGQIGSIQPAGRSCLTHLEHTRIKCAFSNQFNPLNAAD